jgi:hypothetical protein
MSLFLAIAMVPGRADGALVQTDPDAGITELTWLVISRSPAAQP